MGFDGSTLLGQGRRPGCSGVDMGKAKKGYFEPDHRAKSWDTAKNWP